METKMHQDRTLKESFSSALRKIVVGATSIAGLAGMAASEGCSPQQSSYWNGTYTKLPDPPSNARMQIGVSTEADGTVFINYVVWDEGMDRFKREDIHYTTTTLHPGSFQEAGGYEQKITDGEVLNGGAIVDQSTGRLLLPGGHVLDGKTGKLLQ